mmetsp:Transcript_90174/g.252075  ORF Transcript_90174/g.252075 Transcript_90174/m.252075 type:complete len:261 (-) Transcript_90174:339-1121(-)
MSSWRNAGAQGYAGYGEMEGDRLPQTSCSPQPGYPPGYPSGYPSGYADGSLRSTTLAMNFPDTSSDGSDASRARAHHGGFQIEWGRLTFGMRMCPYRRYAHRADDVYLLDRFFVISELADIDGDSVKLLLRMLKFMWLCDYTAEDICSTLAHASRYFVDARCLQLGDGEVGYILATLAFIAHCHVHDETCPLNIWHKYLFRKYCPLKTLNAAVIRLLEIRHFLLRLSDEDLSSRFNRLMEARALAFRVHGPGAGEDYRAG